MKIRIYYEDTDAGGIVYHTNYIKYCERARSEIFFQKNIMPLDGDLSGFVVKNINADFLGFAVLGDMVEVTTKVIKKKTASVLLEQQIFKGEKKIFNMEILLVFVRDGKPKPIPDTLHNTFKEDVIFR
ncbi:4-hydroxybenzoyl-CoA thioesterase family active site [hydrothermal vent metagenome]|uniref:4-hydroxybenzoyl-CoA thioesterase family active site n=1 Tax=hydrothermal vent metagenome TaxID=652676 RepID=A0A1W1CP70_9ZZZZ